jgi:hypothetical protein
VVREKNSHSAKAPEGRQVAANRESRFSSSLSGRISHHDWTLSGYRKGGALQAAEKPWVIEVAATLSHHNINHCNAQMAA